MKTIIIMLLALCFLGCGETPAKKTLYAMQDYQQFLKDECNKGIKEACGI